MVNLQIRQLNNAVTANKINTSGTPSDLERLSISVLQESVTKAIHG